MLNVRHAIQRNHVRAAFFQVAVSTKNTSRRPANRTFSRALGTCILTPRHRCQSPVKKKTIIWIL